MPIQDPEKDIIFPQELKRTPSVVEAILLFSSYRVPQAHTRAHVVLVPDNARTRAEGVTNDSWHISTSDSRDHITAEFFNSEKPISFEDVEIHSTGRWGTKKHKVSTNRMHVTRGLCNELKVVKRFKKEQHETAVLRIIKRACKKFKQMIKPNTKPEEKEVLEGEYLQELQKVQELEMAS
jgi:hypothetical protein